MRICLKKEKVIGQFFHPHLNGAFASFSHVSVASCREEPRELVLPVNLLGREYKPKLRQKETRVNLLFREIAEVT